MAFNIRVIDYPTGKQVRVYDRAMDAPAWENENRVSGNEGMEFCPFTGKMEEVQDELSRRHSLRVSMSRTVNRLYYLARSNKWDYFVTLTFSPDKVDRFDYDVCVKKFSDWLSRCRRKAPDMKYLVVPEQHKNGAWHFHGLFSCCDALGFTDSGKRDKKGNRIYNIGCYRFGFTTATKVKNTEKVSKYISKYITKELCSVAFGRKRFWASRNLQEAPVTDYCLEPGDKRRFLSMIADFIKYVKTVHSVFCRTDYFELFCDFPQKVCPGMVLPEREMPVYTKVHGFA